MYLDFKNYQKRASEASELLVLGLQRGGESRCSLPMVSNMAGPIWMRLSGFVEDRGQSNLAKEFFRKIEK